LPAKNILTDQERRQLSGDYEINTTCCVPAVVLHFDPMDSVGEWGKARLKIGVACDPAGDVADDATQPSTEELQRPPGALELMGVAVAADHDGRAS
jgi:hypothetical protein